MGEVLRLTGAARTYNDGQPVHALRPTDLAIEAGERVAVVGPSGSGKSTLLNLLGLLDEPTVGTCAVRGVVITGAPEPVRVAVRAQCFGFVFQAFHLLAGRTAIENVELGLMYGPYSRRERRWLATAALDRMQLGHRTAADPRTLSGGERQRVAIARAVVGRPDVLFCDEPTGNLDSVTASGVLDLLHELHADGLTVVVVTHDLAVAARSGRVLEVRDGVVSGPSAAGTALR